MRRAGWLLAVVLLSVTAWLAARSLHGKGHGPASVASTASTSPTLAPTHFAHFAVVGTQKLEGWVGDAQKHGLPLAQVCASARGLALADIESAPRCVTTHEDGRYSFSALPIGRYEVVASAGGYIPHRYGEDTDRPFVDLVEQSDPGPIDVTLTPGGVAVAGNVIDPLGRPVMGALVTATVLSDNEGSAADTVTWTDAAGRFSLWTIAGPLAISANAKDYVLAEEKVTAPTSSVTLSLSWGGTIVGSVVDAVSGAPIPFALVTAQRSMTTMMTARAAEDGTYRLEGLEPDSYRLEASAPGRTGSSTHPLRVEGGQTATALVLSLHVIASVSGTVRLPTGAPCVEGRVTLRSDDSTDPSLSGDLDAKGVAFFPAVHAGTYRLEVDCEGFDATSLASKLSVGSSGTKTFDVTTAAGLAIRGDIVDAAGKLVANAHVSAHYLATPGENVSIYQSTRSKADGTFALRGLREGAYELEATADGSAPTSTKTNVQGSSTTIHITLEKQATVSGRVVDEDGKAVAGADVSIDASSGYALATTDVDGRFVGRGIAPGNASVWIRRADGGSLRVVSASAGTVDEDNVRLDLGKGNTTLDVRVERASHWMRGKVVDPSGAIVVGASVEIERGVDSEDGTVKGHFSSYASTTTDKDGRFAFAGLPKGPYRFRAFAAAGFVSAPSVATNAEILVTLEPNAELSGVVTFASGVAPDRFTVRIEAEDGSSYGHTESYFKNGGVFSFVGLAPAKYVVRAIADDGSAKLTTTVVAGEKKTLSLVMESFGEIRGTIGLADGSKGADLLIRADLVVDGDFARASVQADATGSFVLRGLKPGKYRVRASRPGPNAPQFESIEVDVASNGVTTIALTEKEPAKALPQD